MSITVSLDKPNVVGDQGVGSPSAWSVRTIAAFLSEQYSKRNGNRCLIFRELGRPALLLLKHDIRRFFVLPQPEKGRMTHLAVAGPLSELYLGDERGFDQVVVASSFTRCLNGDDGVRSGHSLPCRSLSMACENPVPTRPT